MILNKMIMNNDGEQLCSTNITPESLSTLDSKIVSVAKANPNVRFYFFDKSVDFSRDYFNHGSGVVNFFSPVIGGAVNFGFKLCDYAKLSGEILDSLTSVATKVNESFYYDMNHPFAKKVVDYRSHSRGESKLNRGSNLTPGICIDSVNAMGRVIDNENVPVYWFNTSLQTTYKTNHAFLMCFDNQGNWVLLNGKRPRDNDFSVVTLDKLVGESKQFILQSYN